MELARSPRFVRSVAIVAVAMTIAAAIHLGVLLPLFGPPAPVLALVLGVLVSAGYAGLIAGLLASAIAIGVVASGVDWTQTARASTEVARLGLFALGCVLATLLADALYRARRRAESAYRAIARESVKKREAEQRLESSEARLRELIDSFPDIMFVADAWGGSEYENARWSEFSGTSPRDTGPVHWAERVHPADRDRVLGAWSVSVNSGVPFEARCRLGDSSGDYRWFLVRARAVRSSADQPAYWFGVATDIDAQMRAEATLRDREEQLRLALESTGLGVFEIEFWTRHVVWSEGCRAICGFASDEPLSPRRLRAVVHPDDRRRTVRAFARAIDPAGTGDCALELRVVRPDGEVRWVAARGCVFFVSTADGDRAIRCIGTLLDITDSERAKGRLEHSEQLFRLAAGAVNGIIYEQDVEAGTVLRTRGLLELVGYEPAEVPPTAEWWLGLMHPEDAAKVWMQDARDEASGAERMEREYRVRHRLGHWVTLLDRAVVARNKHGRVVRIIGCAEDITELRRVEQTLREADRRKDEFLATLAHELRNPLAPMHSAVRLLDARHHDQDARVADYARRVIDRQLAQMVRLIDDLLDVARISAGKLSLQRSEVTVAEVVERAVETVMPLIEERRHRIDVRVPPENVKLVCDATRIAQVLANLLHNSAKYTPIGGQITLRAETGPKHVVFEVRDNGVGVTPANLESMFEMFRQGEANPGDTQSGLGVGLPLARALVALHDGQLQAHSDGPGRGTMVSVRLPRSALAATASTAPAPVPLAAGSTRRILVVDDNRDAAETLALLLRGAGHEVRVCYDGVDAIRTAEVFRPEVALLDIGMPRLDGHEVARRLRAQPWGRRMRILALSGFGQAEDRRRSFEAGCDEHLIKPVPDVELSRAISGPGGFTRQEGIAGALKL